MSPNNESTRTVYEAMSLVQTGDKQGAKRIIDEILQADPTNTYAWHLKCVLTDDLAEQLDALKMIHGIYTGKHP